MDAESEANLYRTYEKQRHDATRQRPILPVTIITGFLGAGKTTLLRKILRSKVSRLGGRRLPLEDALRGRLSSILPAAANDS